MTSINALMIDMGTALYYEERFRLVLETHLKFLREHQDTRVIRISPEQAYRFEGDLHGLLRERQQPRHLHWLIMRMSGLHHPGQVTPHTTLVLLIPSPTVVDSIAKRYRASAG